MNRAEVFAGFPLLDGLSDRDLDHLETAARPAAFAAGERIVEQGEPATACWLLESGRVAIDTPAPAHEPVVIQTLGPGDLLGWSWLVPPNR